MSVVKRMFRQQSARVASSSTSNSLGRHQQASATSGHDVDVDEEEEKFVISSADDTALILSQRRGPIRRAPLHSNSFVCLFTDRTTAATARGLSNHSTPKQLDPADEAGNIKRQGLIFRSASPSGRLRCATAPAGRLAEPTPPRRSFTRTATYDDLASFGRSIEGYRLTVQQRALIRQCWHASNRKGKSNESSGSYVLRWLFKREPRLKRVFDLANVADNRLAIDPRFLKHAQTFSDVLEMVVDSVCGEQDSTSLLDDTMGPFLCSHGAEHAAMEKISSAKYDDAGFRSSDWDLLATALREFAIDSWRSGSSSWTPLGPFQKRNEALHAWHVLVHFVVAKVKRGYELEKERLNSSPSSTELAALKRDEGIC